MPLELMFFAFIQILETSTAKFTKVKLITLVALLHMPAKCAIITKIWFITAFRISTFID